MTQEREFSFVGKSITRVDAWEKVTGAAIYGVDFKLPGMLFGKILRSPYPHARILNVDTSRAGVLPGIKAVITGRSVPMKPHGAVIKDTHFLGIEKVRYIGEPVAAVAAVTEEIATEALALIKVTYEELPAVFDPREAMKPGAPLIHERVQDYRCGPDVFPVPDSNICQHLKVRKGDVEAGFAQADLISEDEFFCQPVQHCPMEPHAAVAQVEPSGKINLWSNTQTPNIVRAHLTEALDLPMNKLRVITTYVGGGFGCKAIATQEEALAVFLAFKTRGKPVKITYSREEEFIGTVTRHGAYLTYKTGVKKDGTITARQVRILWNGGAYSETGEWVARNAGIASAGPYRTPNIRIDSFSVYTNNVVAGPFRGFGDTQITWASEQQMDILARKLGLDPVVFRQKNLYEEGSISATGETLHSVSAKETLAKAVDAMDWKEQKPPFSGRGLACIHKATNPGTSAGVILMMHEDATITLMSSAVDEGQGSNTVLSQMVAEELGLPLEAITLTRPDTEITPYDFGSVSSRITFHQGNAVLQAAREVRERLFEMAAEVLEANPADLDLKAGKIFVRGNPEQGITLADLFLPFRHSGMQKGYVMGRGTFTSLNEIPLDRETGQSKKPTAFWMYATQGAEVQVDPETGEINLIKMVAAHDVGKVINPFLTDAQIHGSLSFGVGSALLEEMVMERGRVVNPNFTDYLLLTAMDMPRFVPLIVEKPHQDGPYGAKGFSDAAIAPTMAAVANAVADAIGARVLSGPITPEKVLKALREKTTQG